MAYKKLKYWFDKNLAELISQKLKANGTNFNEEDFIKSIDRNVVDLELKDRVELIADELYLRLDKDYKKGIVKLMDILGPENEKETGMFTEFYWIMPIAKYVEKYGLNDFEISMIAIEKITKRNTGEYTIRPFIEKDLKKTMQQMMIWSVNPNKHVRRLSSEGVRPRLPWAKKLDIFIENPKPIIPILNNLKDDPSKYIQKSVANCINDIFKDNYDVGKELIESWNGKQISKERKWIIKHALRNLLKENNNWAIEMTN
ncbi:3-methyladenine DNA glycosylase [Sabulilitoribacter multivorans]|uniref:3-methyladenine DNA glycosylase n=1 Tax=Flaviramulus multivorans TaxID=1304750 RepID=A0ABS9IIU9_9FLAO|nr:3-methyladenine DNA glycosylase [Flaviramulus multivorans]MCF7560405.1 3-methyladenine DNA glycosylase [Flaviramulus multivorans]